MHIKSLLFGPRIPASLCIVGLIIVVLKERFNVYPHMIVERQNSGHEIQVQDTVYNTRTIGDAHYVDVPGTNAGAENLEPDSDVQDYETEIGSSETGTGTGARRGVVSMITAEHSDIPNIPENEFHMQRQHREMKKLFKENEDAVQLYDALVSVVSNHLGSLNYTVRTYNVPITTTSENYSVDCSNIHNIKLHMIEGHGDYKIVYRGVYQGKDVVLKVYRTTHNSISRLLRSNVEILKEILIAKELPHPMLAEPYGYCIHTGVTISDIFFIPGIITVYEFGAGILNFAHTPWEIMLDYAIDVADFLKYADTSPIGRLVISDLSYKQFFILGSRLVMSDYHMIYVSESCDVERHIFDSIGNHRVDDCRYNMLKANFTFFQYLLKPSRFPEGLRETVKNIGSDIKNYSINATQLVDRLNDLHHKVSVS